MKEIKQKPEIYHFQCWVSEANTQKLIHACKEALIASKLNVLQFSEQAFPGGGYTSLWLLGESHLALHQFMPDGKGYVELASCNKEKALLFISTFRSLFKKEQIRSSMESYSTAS